MWRLNVNEPESKAYWVELKPGLTSIGRSSENIIAITDSSASRRHAEILISETEGVITVEDLNSTNGTYVNRKRISSPVALNNSDTIRIGRVVLNLTNESGSARSPVMGTHFFTREIVLESLDEHAVLIDEVAQKLNTIMDVPSMVNEISAQLKRILMVDEANIVLANQLSSLLDTRALKSIHNRSVEIIGTRMYIPIIDGNELRGVICMSRDPSASQFSRRDMELAIAISHQSAMSLNRLRLVDKNRDQERVRDLLLRFVSPLEMEFLLKDYLKSGKLPELVEQKATILFSDIVDSTGIAERIGPKHFAEFLTSYYEDVTDIVFRHGGIMKYLGDGIMAVFVSTIQPHTVPPQEMRAVQAGWEILKHLKSHDYHGFENEQLTVGLAVNTGPAMAGYIGVGGRAEFHVLGDTVNTASRMQSYARPNRLVAGPGTMAVVAGKFLTHRIGEMEFRGRSAPIQIFEILGERATGDLEN
jgi:class 3 adenylate cyclase